MVDVKTLKAHSSTCRGWVVHIKSINTYVEYLGMPIESYTAKIKELSTLSYFQNIIISNDVDEICKSIQKLSAKNFEYQ